MNLDSLTDPLWSLELERRRALQIASVLEARVGDDPSEWTGCSRGPAALGGEATRRSLDGRDRTICFVFETLVLRHQAQKEESTLFPWLWAHHGDFAEQWTRELRQIRTGQARLIDDLRASIAEQGDAQERLVALRALAALERRLLATLELEMLPVIRGWSPRMAIAHLSACLARFDSARQARRLERALEALRALASPARPNAVPVEARCDVDLSAGPESGVRTKCRSPSGGRRVCRAPECEVLHPPTGTTPTASPWSPNAGWPT